MSPGRRIWVARALALVPSSFYPAASEKTGCCDPTQCPGFPVNRAPRVAPHLSSLVTLPLPSTLASATPAPRCHTPTTHAPLFLARGLYYSHTH
ncbi:hypothetical protein BD779DRAFT_1804918, partial [Infundibulicybe gibba]